MACSIAVVFDDGSTNTRIFPISLDCSLSRLNAAIQRRFHDVIGIVRFDIRYVGSDGNAVVLNTEVRPYLILVFLFLETGIFFFFN